MTVVDTVTGEVVDLDPTAAERRAERIRLRLDSIAENYAAVLPAIREAIEKRDDLALGYRSVSEYVADRFGGALTNLGLDVRREVVRELTQAGMSSRAIAPVVGVSDRQVRRDLPTGTDVPVPTGIDGIERRRPQAPSPAQRPETHRRGRVVTDAATPQTPVTSRTGDASRDATGDQPASRPSG